MSETPKIIIRSHNENSIQNKEFPFSVDSMRLPAKSKYLQKYRQNAWNQYLNIPFPSTKEEAWRRTNLSKLNPGDFHLLNSVPYNNGRSENKYDQQLMLRDDVSGQIIQTPEYTSVSLDKRLEKEGVVFCDLLSAEEKHQVLLEKVMGRIVQSDSSKFAALSASLAQYGALLYIPSGRNISEPFYYHLHGNGTHNAFLSHILVYLEDEASASFIIEETSNIEQDGKSFSSNNFEVYAGNNSNLSIIKIQNWGENVYNFSHEKVVVTKDAHVDWIVAATGSLLTKSFLDLDIINAGGSGNMYGIYIPDKKQHFDYDTQQNHLAPHTQSDLMYKGVLLGNSRAVWQGMIYVAPKAMKTDGYQMNRNLLLSPEARVDTIPGLEILANDVRCTHGATVGKIDRDQLFYLLSRGIPLPDAEKLLVDGFFEPVIKYIPSEMIRNRVQQLIDKKLLQS